MHRLDVAPGHASPRTGRSVASTMAALVVVAIVGGGCALSPISEEAPPTAAPPSVLPSASPAPSFIRPTPTARPTFMAYVVVAGDTLTSIARQFATTPESIAFWNRATYPSLDPDSRDYEPDRIRIGWTLLLIPDVEVSEEEMLAETPGPSAPPSASPDPSVSPAAS